MQPSLTLTILALTGAILVHAQTGSPGAPRTQTVKVTPIGARTGEFCSPDRALLFEDPSGVRILFDPATTVAGADDARLGDIHAILVSHAHPDHIGNAKLNQDPGAASAACGSGVPVTATPNSNAAGIAAGKHAAVIVASELGAFMSRKIQTVLGSTVPNCPALGATNEMTLPLTQACVGAVGYGAKRTIRNPPAETGVQIAVIPAAHGNGPPADEITDPLRTELSENNLSVPPGQASSYIIRFTNGMVAFLSGDTGLTSEMRNIVHDFYRANFAVFNMGDIFTTGPEEAAFAINAWIRPASVIPSHANEQATTNGSANAGTKTARFMDLVREAGVYPPLSGAVMEFDGFGRCVAACVGKQQQSHNCGTDFSLCAFDSP
jgi:L-ascorbate metabolism protein UlaG (beta-lactamase superfamily)